MKALKYIIIISIIITLSFILTFSISTEENKTVSETYEKVIAFTFDDGPSIYTREIADVLLLYNSKATFFETGINMKNNQEIVSYLINNKMEIASHTYSHKNLAVISEERIREELNSTSILFNEITNKEIRLCRVPYGIVNDKIKRNMIFPIIGWSIDTKDWLYKNENYIVDLILENVSDGDIILMHDIYSSSLKAVKKVLPLLIDMGYKITSVSELAKIKGIELKPGEIYRSFN